MMKMATGEGFPLRQGAGTGLDWLSVAMEASGGRTPDFRVRGYIWVKEIRQGSHEGPTRVEGAPPASWPPSRSPDMHSKSSGLLLIQK